MRQDAWRRDAAAYPLRGEFMPRYTDVDVWQHMNNSALIGLQGEAMQHALRHALGPRFWRDSDPVIACRGLATDFLAETHYPEAIGWGARLLGVDRQGLRVATALFQHGRCVGLHEALVAGWVNGLATDLGAGALDALRSAKVPGDDPGSGAAVAVDDEPVSRTLASLPWRTTIASRFADSDARRLASDTFLARCAEQVRVAFLGECFGGHPRRLGSMMVAHVTLRWHRRAAPGRQWEAGCGITRVSERSLSASSAFYEDGVCVASSDSVMVAIDPDTRRSATLSAQARELVAPWQLADLAATR
jgi:acyl-CoA thioester hydrolase